MFHFGTQVQRATLVACLLALATSAAQGANHYVRPGAGGSASGNDWTNAYTSIPATLIRGDTYYLAGGSYGNRTFSNATSGSLYIYIKKATVADHGTSTGWSDSYATSAAAFTGWYFSSGYWNINGQTGSGKSGYGITVHDTSASGDLITINGSNIVISNIEAYKVVTSCNTTTDLNDVIYAVTGGSNLTIKNSYLHDSNSWAMMGVNGWTGVMFDNNYFMNACKKELLSARGNSNLTFKNNIAENSAGTGIIVMENPVGVYIYNNVFFTTNPSVYSTTDCIFCNWYGSGMNATNVFIYGNTFVNLQPQTVIGFDSGSNIVVQNNLFYGSNGISFVGSLSHDYNWCYPSGSACSAVTSEAHGQAGSTGIFLNLSGGDFRLANATNAGATLSSPYNLDLLGATRGADGVFDRGAYEFSTGTNPLPVVSSLTCTPTTIQSIGTTTCTAQASDTTSYDWTTSSCGSPARCSATTPTSSANTTYTCSFGGYCTPCVTPTGPGGTGLQLCAATNHLIVRYRKPTGLGVQ